MVERLWMFKLGFDAVKLVYDYNANVFSQLKQYSFGWNSEQRVI